MGYIISLDQGTTSSRAIVFDQGGGIVAVAQKEFRQIFPKPGWVEHDPGEIWASQTEVVAEVLNRAGISSAAIEGVAITNQRETTIIWDKATGAPIYNAIVWQDRRTADRCEELSAEGRSGLFQQKTGLVLDAYFSGTKIAWLLDHVNGARERAERGELAFGTVDTWLAYQLTDKKLHITDSSNASRTLLYNIHTNEWDEQLCDLLNVPLSLLPEVRSSSEVYGTVTSPAELAGTQLAGIAGDQQAATMGQVCIEPGMAKNTYGTGCFLVMNAGSQVPTSQNRLLATVAWNVGGQTSYALEGSVFVGGAIVQWLRDGLKLISDAPSVNDLAAAVKDNGGVYFVPALTGLGAPYWKPHARGIIIGITRGTTDAHIARAALEGIAFQVADLVAAMEKDAGKKITELRVDGGAAASNPLLQFQADILQIPIIRPTVLETTALGAAYMAGLAVGFWKSADEIAANWKVDRVFEPEMSAQQAQALKETWRHAVALSQSWMKGKNDA